MSKKKAIGVIYSTNPDYQYQYDDEPEAETLPPSKQRLRVQIDRHHRGGKVVTLVTGFIGTDDDLQELGRLLKSRCGVGGSAKDGEIIIQGEHLDKVKHLLIADSYNVR
jgi:translation initiation factor 1